MEFGDSSMALNKSLVSLSSDEDREETKDIGSESSLSSAAALIAAGTAQVEPTEKPPAQGPPGQGPPPQKQQSQRPPPNQQRKASMQFKAEGQFTFYHRQLEKIQSSGIDIKNVAPEDIMKQLVGKGRELRRDTNMDIRDKLKMIKVDNNIMPNLLANDINEQINNQKEIKSNNDLKRFLYSKQNAQNKLLVQELKKYPNYSDQNHFLNFKPTEGKSLDFVENCDGQKFMICQFIDATGTHLKIFNFDINSGTIGTEVLREQIIGDVNKDIDEENEGSDEDEDEAQKKVNQILALTDQAKLKELFQNAPELKQYNIFNKIYTKFKENVYFFKVVNDYDTEISHIKLVKFNLLTLKQEDVLKAKIEKEDTEIHTANDEDKLETKQPFGISQIAFQDSPNSHSIEEETEIEEIDFIDRQFVMMISTDFNGFSLRKVKDLEKNIFYYEHDHPTTWTLYMHDDNVKKLNYPFTIGSVTRCKSYQTLISGSLAHDVGNSHWTVNLHDANNPHLESLIELRYTQPHHKIYISRLNDNKKIEFNVQRMVDTNNRNKIKFMKIHSIEAQQEKTTNYLKMLYMNNEFNLDTFQILQDQQTDKTYLFFSSLVDNRLRVIQMKTNLTSVICKP